MRRAPHLRAVVEGQEDLCIDDANVHDPPEHIFPPAAAGSPHAVVGPQLVQAVHSAHVLTVLMYTGMLMIH